MDYYHGWPDLFLAQGVISNSALKGTPTLETSPLLSGGAAVLVLTILLK